MWALETGLEVERIDPICFLAGFRKRQLNRSLSVCYLILGFFWLFFYLCLLCCCVFCALIVLAMLSVLAKWLAGKTPQVNPLASRGDFIHKDQVEECVYVVCIVCDLFSLLSLNYTEQFSLSCVFIIYEIRVCVA